MSQQKKTLLSVLVRALLLPALLLLSLLGGVAHAAEEVAPHEPAIAAAPSADTEQADPELDVDLHDAPPTTDKKAYADFLRLALEKARPRVVGKLEEKMAASQQANMNRLSTGMFLFSLLGLLLVFRPLFLLRRFPGQAGKLFGYGALSAGLFFVTVNLFAMVIGVLKVTQGAAGHFTNPQVAVVEAAFDILDRNAEELVDVAPKLIEPSLHQLAKGDASFLVVLLENFKGIKGDIDAILAVAKAMKALDGVFAWIPSILTLVAIVTFALSAKDTLLAVVRLPEAAASGAGAGAVIRGALGRVKNELFATFFLIVAIVVLAITGGMALRAAVEPAVEAFLSTVFLVAVYLQVEKASSLVLLGSLGLSAFVLVLNIGVVLAASSAAIGKLHEIFRRKFHERLPLGAHARFWKRAPFAVAICFSFPLGYELLAEKAVEGVLHHTLHAEHPRYALALVGSPALMVVGFVLCFALVLGVHSLLFLFRYPAKTIAAPTPAFAPSPDLAVFDRLVPHRGTSTAP